MHNCNNITKIIFFKLSPILQLHTDKGYILNLNRFYEFKKHCNNKAQKIKCHYSLYKKLSLL